MKLLRKIFSPLKTLIAIQLVWITLVVFWINWFVKNNREFSELAEKYRPELLGTTFNWVVMAEGLIMLVVIMAGVYVIFHYWNRQSRLYAKHRNFISQVTHELKSPLASIQLHLETIRLRRLSQEKLNAFVNTMLSDTERLHYLINNLLMMARLEQRRKPVERRLTDISAMLLDYVERERAKLSTGGSIALEAEEGVKLLVDPEEMEIVLRNLFENAILYSPASPEIVVRLADFGAVVKIVLRDKGRGLDKSELKKVFGMFYRVRHEGENVPGTGLGLYIVDTIIRGYGGTISAKSDGPGQGCAFTINMPKPQIKGD